MFFWEANQALLLEDQPAEFQILAFKLDSNKIGIVFPASIRNDSDLRINIFKKWIRSKAASGATVKELSDESYRAAALHHRASIKNRVIKTVREFNNFVPDDWNLIDLNLSDEAKTYIVPIRFGRNSSSAVLFVSEEIDYRPDVLDAYGFAKSKITSELWCDKVDQVRCSQSVIEFALNSRVQVTNNSSVENEAESVKAVKHLIADAVEQRASDIHINLVLSDQGTSIVKFRVDKALHDYTPYASKTLLPMLRQLYSNLRNGAGDGQEFNPSAIQEADIDLNVSLSSGKNISLTIRWESGPVHGGCYIVLRVLKNDNTYIREMSFLEFGYEDFQIEQLNNAMAPNSGLILTVGVTNSGKSTTNLKILLEIQKHKPHWAISTVEDPIEYRIEGVSQHQVELSSVDAKDVDEETHRKMAFSKTLKAMLRKDPNVIGVGEIRDQTTASTVQQFVDTGHKIITTLHADSALYAFDRLINIGIDRASLCKPGFCSAIIYQALLPKVCHHCALDYTSLTSSKRNALIKILTGSNIQTVRIANPNGCKHCRGGVSGLTACAEIIEPNSNLLQFIRVQDYVGAEKYWKESMPIAGPRYQYQGKTIEDHIVWKIALGILCPIKSEEYLKSLEHTAANKTFEHLFKVEKLKAVSVLS